MTAVTVLDPCTLSQIHVSKSRTKDAAMRWPCIRREDVGGERVDIGVVGTGPDKAGPDSEMRKDSSTASGSITIRSLTPPEPEEGLGS